MSLLLLGAACSGDDTPDRSLPDDDTTPAGDDDTTDETTDALLGETFHVAQAAKDPLAVRASAQATADELVSLSAEDEVSGAVTFLVVQQVGEWVEVQLPSGPTDRTGWVARDDVTLSRHRFHIEVSLSEYSMTLYTGEVEAISAPVALGPDAPEAGEEVFIKDLVEPPTRPPRRYGYGCRLPKGDRFTSGEGSWPCTARATVVASAARPVGTSRSVTTSSRAWSTRRLPSTPSR